MDKVTEIYRLLELFTFDYSLYKALRESSASEYDKAYEPHVQLFWNTVANNSLQMAAINWCKIFGSSSNKTYYSNIVDKDAFIEIIAAKNIDFAECSAEIRRFRNKYIAHEEKYGLPVPVLSDALEIACLLGEEIKRMDVIYPDLRWSYECYFSNNYEYIKELKTKNALIMAQI